MRCDEISVGKSRCCCGKLGAMILSPEKQAARLTSSPGRQNGQKRKVERLEREFAAKRLGVLCSHARITPGKAQS